MKKAVILMACLMLFAPCAKKRKESVSSIRDRLRKKTALLPGGNTEMPDAEETREKPSEETQEPETLPGIDEKGLVLYYENEYDLNFVYKLYPRVNKKHGVKPGGWVIRSVYNEEIMIEGKFHKLVIWSEVNSPYARTAYQKVHNGGLLVYNDGGILYTNRKFADFKLDNTIENKGNDICIFRNFVYGRGEVAEYLHLCKMERKKLLTLNTIQIGMNDSGSGGDLCIESEVLYRDIDGNGIKDVLIEIFTCRDRQTVSRTNILF